MNNQPTHEIYKQINRAMIFPICLGSAAMAICVVLMYAVVPKMKDLYVGATGDENAQLPFLTRMVVEFSNFIASDAGIALTLLVVALIILVKQWLPTTMLSEWHYRITRWQILRRCASTEKRNDKRRDERGFTLIEMAISMTGFVMVSLLLANIVTIGTMSHEATKLKRAADESADTALDALARQPITAFPTTGGTFTLNADKTIAITGACAASTCDMVLSPETDLPLPQKTSLAAGVPWTITVTPGAPPAGSTRRYVRRWRVDTVDAALGLRRITVVVLRDDQSTEPIAVASAVSDVSLR